MSTKIWTRVCAVLAAVGLTISLAACGTDSDKNGADSKEIKLGIIPGWTDGVSMAHLWKVVLEDEGYDVEIEELGDAPLTYTNLSRGSVDVYPSAWPDVTHASLMEKYPKLEDLGTYYDNAKLTFAVPDYSDLQSIEDMVGKGGDYNGKIVGIEPGAGLTKITKESVMPEYGLDDEYKLVTSSTATMLAELKRAIDAKRDIVVTLWRPFYANSKFPVRDLEDPKGALGESEGLHEVARPGFTDDFAEVAEMMGKAKLTDEQYGSLEDLVVNQYGEGKEEDAVKQWLKDNPDWLDTIK
ncbi:glycine betaine ABC transporter substrate-binding protein [Nocardioides daejeonensis]|uniref:glycine betaine ABC transporter substrate-binding protein n=1 Tax=Nocardioides daejeonensis TaxID=1046556 RepID=UPI000D74CF96|nr:glycine betaine ABC transporter substrate-binding protein [Nocardioides daejeonensis]